MTKIEHIIKEIEVIDGDGMFRSQVDLECGFLIMPSHKGRIKFAFWDKNRRLMFVECYGFLPIIMQHSRN